jgi:hypothetical protein
MPPGRCFNATGIRSKVCDSLAIPDILDWLASGTNSFCSGNGSGASKALWAPAGRESGTGGQRLKNAFSPLEPACGVLCAHLDRASVNENEEPNRIAAAG